MPVAMSRHAGSVVTSLKYGKELLLAGGLAEDDSINPKTYLYHLKDQKWREGPDFPTKKDLSFDRVS